MVKGMKVKEEVRREVGEGDDEDEMPGLIDCAPEDFAVSAVSDRTAWIWVA